MEERNIEITQINQTQATQTDQFLKTIQELETKNISHTEDIEILKEELEDSNNEVGILTKENNSLKTKLESVSNENNGKDDEIRILSS